MLEWLEQNWQWLTGIVIGGLIALVVYWRQHRPKTLDYQIVNNIPILANRSGEIADKLNVTYDSFQVKDPRIITVRIVNTGKRSIMPSDYEGRVRITFEQYVLIDGSISSAANDDIKTKLFFVGAKGELLSGPPRFSAMSLEFGLLNPGEWVELLLISDGDPGEISVTARFADQARQMRALSAERQATWSIVSLIAGLGLGFLIITALEILPPAAFFPVATVAFVLLAVTRVWLWRRPRNPDSDS